MILDIKFFDNLILVDGLFAKALPRPATCLSISNNLCTTFLLLAAIIFHDSRRVTPVSLSVADFNLSAYESDNFTFILLYFVNYILELN